MTDTSRPTPPLSRRSNPFLIFFLLAGCGGPADDVPRTQQEYLSVIDHEGTQRVIPAGELTDPKTGRGAVQSVLVIDRRTGREEWIPVEDLLRAPPATARYIPRTRSEPETEPEIDR